MLKKDFPILEFDPALKAKIEPSDVIKKKNVPEHCVITFFSDVIKRMLNEGRLKKLQNSIQQQLYYLYMRQNLTENLLELCKAI